MGEELFLTHKSWMNEKRKCFGKAAMQNAGSLLLTRPRSEIEIRVPSKNFSLVLPIPFFSAFPLVALDLLREGQSEQDRMNRY